MLPVLRVVGHPGLGLHNRVTVRSKLRFRVAGLFEDRFVHYSEQQPKFELIPHDGCGRLEIRGSGFVTADLIHRAFRRWTAHRQDAGDPPVPARVLVDLREVSGYGGGCARLARGWLFHAQTLGVCQVALVAGSTVLRTASQVLAKGVPLQLRCFEHCEPATRWLGGLEDRAPAWTCETQRSSRSQPEV